MHGAPYGIVLAGGQARRMGGGDKGLLPFRAGTMLDAVVQALAPQCTGLLLSANGDPARFARMRLPVIADHSLDVGAGPLAGVLAGLDAVAALDASARDAVTVPSDTPLLPPDLVARLCDARRSAGVDVCVACSDGRQHSTVALWSIDIRHELRRLVRETGLRRVTQAQHALGCCFAEWSVAGGDPFHNVNTPADFAAVPAGLPGTSDAGHRNPRGRSGVE